MKKLLMFIMCICVFLCGCNVKKETEKIEKKEVNSTSETVAQKEEVNPFYEMASNSSRPVAVMIDNDSDSSRPQIGLENAYLIYEIIVEGGASRFMALFKDYNIEKVGPVRSSRHYFLDYAIENGAIYAHAGFSPKAKSDISSLKINNINGINGDDGVNFWRDNTYDKTYHNLYTSIKKLSQYAETKKGYSVSEERKSPIQFLKKDEALSGEDCNEVSFAYSNMYKVEFKYNQSSGLYERYINGKAHMSQTENILTAKNIIVYKLSNYDLKDNENKGRQEINNLGSGEGYYISMGKCKKITWSKNSRTEKTEYLKEDGKKLKVNPGITYVQIIPQTSSLVLQ